MPSIAILSATVSGDIGGSGISRFHVKRVDDGVITVPDCNAAAAAIRAWYNAAVTYIPTNVGWGFPAQVTLIDELTGALQGYLNLSSIPAAVTGTDSGPYAAGTGARVNWTSSTIHNRRLMRSANYLVPLGQAGFGAVGAVLSTFITAMNAASAALLAAMVTANLEFLVYSRPPKGTQTGGHSAIITGYRWATAPSGLRSRRV
jgi:hypothetical protein